MKTPRSSPIERQLRAYEEGWKEAHDEAMRYWDFRENLSVGIGIFRAIANRNASWRQRVSQSVEPFRVEDNEEVLGLFKWWLNPCVMALERLDYFEREFGSVDGGSEFRQCCEEAKQAVEKWVPPILSKATGLHAAEFSEEEGKKLSKVLDSGGARLRSQPRQIE